MKKTLLLFIVLAILVAPSISSAAPPRQGPYLSGFIGLTIPSDTDVTGFGLNDHVEFDPGLNIGGTAGFDFGMMRLEGELSYKQADISRVDDLVSGVVYRGIDGGIDATAFMANVFVDLHNESPITPYFGGGVGFASIHQSDTYGTSNLSGSRTLLYGSDDDSVLAYQVGGGLEVALNRQLSLDLAYRYFGTTKASFIDNELEFESHNATVGLRLKY